MSKHEFSDKRVPIESDNVSITRDNSKCVLCGACKSVCKFSQGVYGNYSLEENNDRAICINCGQCANVCPVDAITEVKDYEKVRDIIKTGKKTVIFQTSPSVRVSLGEAFGLDYGTFVEGKMVDALYKLGANYVFDTNFGADLTIMEEANELVDRIKNNGKLPMFTSCCPAWITYVETFFPEYLDNLSTAKSPILMQGPIIKNYVARKLNIDAKDIINVAVTPCTAKKFEIKRPEMNKVGLYLNDESIRDMDYIITTRELASWIKEENIDFNSLEDKNYDSLLGQPSGAGRIFGNTGGVMEAALRTSYHLLTGNNPTSDLLDFKEVRGLDGIKEATININGTDLKIAVITGTNNAKKFLNKMKEEKLHYDFIEVMACIGGCIAGGGQIKYDQMIKEEVKNKRMDSLYKSDTTSSIRSSHENIGVMNVYKEFLNNPLSKESEELLHTTYKDLSIKDKIIN